jgi:hypothetical protein
MLRAQVEETASLSSVKSVRLPSTQEDEAIVLGKECPMQQLRKRG